MLVARDPEPLAPRFPQLLVEVVLLEQGDGRVDVLDPGALEEVHLLGERRLDHLGRARDDRARGAVHGVADERREVRDAGEEDVVERTGASVLMLVEDQIVDVSLVAFTGVARVNRAVFPTLGEHFLAGGIAPDHVLAREPDRLEVSPPDRPRRVHVEDSRQAELDLRAPLGRLGRGPLEAADLLAPLDSPEKAALDLDRANLGTRRRHVLGLVEVFEGELGLELEDVGIDLAPLAPVGLLDLERLFAFDGALFAAEPGDIA